MAQKSNPISLRLRKTNKFWNSCWYGDYNYTQQLLKDLGVSAYIQNICQQAKMVPPVAFLSQQRHQTSLFLFFSRREKPPRLKRPFRGGFGKSTLGDPPGQAAPNWLLKLLFRSVAPVHAPRQVNNNIQRLLIPARVNQPVPEGPAQVKRQPAALPCFSPSGTGFGDSNRIDHSSHNRRNSPHPRYSSGQLFGWFLYLLVSGAVTPSCQQKKPPFPSGLEMENSMKLRFPCVPQKNLLPAHIAETTGPSESPAVTRPGDSRDFLLSTLKKKSYPGGINKRIYSAPANGMPKGMPFDFLKTCPQDWGFFAMRNQYFTSAQISSLSPSGTAFFPNRLSRPALVRRVQQPSNQSPRLRSRQVDTPKARWRTHLESCISAQTHHNSTLHFLLCPSVHQNPLFLAKQICFSLETRKPFRRLKDKIIRDISKEKGIKGVRISCSGRVAARSKKAQKARTESIQWGQTSLNVFSDRVSFASQSALTPFGKIGVKVWICYK